MVKDKNMNTTTRPKLPNFDSRRPFILVARASNRMEYFYVESATQGAKMVPNAYSIAKRFMTVASARSMIDQMQANYRGLTGWKAVRAMI